MISLCAYYKFGYGIVIRLPYDLFIIVSLAFTTKGVSEIKDHIY